MKIFVFGVVVLALSSCASLNKANISLVQIELLTIDLQKAFPDFKGQDRFRDMFELTISSDKDLFELARNDGTTMVLRNTLALCQSDNNESFSFPRVYVKESHSEFKDYMSESPKDASPSECSAQLI